MKAFIKYQKNTGHEYHYFKTLKASREYQKSTKYGHNLKTEGFYRIPCIHADVVGKKFLN